MAHISVLGAILCASVHGTRPRQADSLLPALKTNGEGAVSFASLGVEEYVSASRPSTCSKLSNHGTHFTVKVAVGKTRASGQEFNLVVDTGSDALIVSDCRCTDCDDVSCYHRRRPSVGQQDGLLILSFGSGKIYSEIASDIVNIGGRSVDMSGSLLAMVQRDLSIDLRFEGILGLGQLSGGKHFKGFLEQAGIAHFSMCFTVDGGFLRLGVKPQRTSLRSVGKMHWALDFRGVTIRDGGNRGPGFCSAEAMPSGQRTPCGAIPDSGTTLIMAPEEHLTDLFVRICDAWSHCSGESVRQKVQSLHDKVSLCENLDSLPPLQFHLTDPTGKQVTLELNGTNYVMETEQDVTVQRSLMGISLLDITLERQSLCRVAFGPMSYDTADNGPVWILGTPFFYKYQVFFQNHHTDHPAIAFSEGRCTECKKSFGSGIAGSLLSRSHSGVMRFSGPPRTPFLDTTLPL